MIDERDKHRDEVPLLRTGIAWDSDKNIKFRNPPGNLTEAFKNFSKPKAWKQPVYELDKDDPNNNGFQNEDLIVWMRTAALPTFRKLYRRIDHSASQYMDGLRRGKYELEVDYCNYQFIILNDACYDIVGALVKYWVIWGGFKILFYKGVPRLEYHFNVSGEGVVFVVQRKTAI